MPGKKLNEHASGVIDAIIENSSVASLPISKYGTKEAHIEVNSEEDVTNTGTKKSTVIKDFRDKKAYNGPKWEDLNERGQLLIRAAIKMIELDTALNQEEKNIKYKQLQKLAIEFEKTIQQTMV